MMKLDDPGRAAPLFGDWPEAMIWSCLQGVMGDIYADSHQRPGSAMALVADFCFLAGQPCRDLLRSLPALCPGAFLILVPQDGRWAKLIEDTYGDRAERIIRYAIKKEGDIFDRRKLRAAVDSLPPEYSLQMIDEALFYQCREEEWSRDLVSKYPDYEAFERLGLGAVILRDGELLSGASSYTRYREGIEVEIDTREDCRRRGLAYVCGARLILACLERNLYPSWDAHNLESAALAEKLGYHLDHPYEAFEISC